MKYGAGPSGYTCVNRHVTTAGHAPAASAVSSTAVVTASCSAAKRSHVHAVSNVSLIMPERDERVAGVRRADERVAPAPGRAFARALGRRRSRTTIASSSTAPP